MSLGPNLENEKYHEKVRTLRENRTRIQNQSIPLLTDYKVGESTLNAYSMYLKRINNESYIEAKKLYNESPKKYKKLKGVIQSNTNSVDTIPYSLMVKINSYLRIIEQIKEKHIAFYLISKIIIDNVETREEAYLLSTTLGSLTVVLGTMYPLFAEIFMAYINERCTFTIPRVYLGFDKETDCYNEHFTDDTRGFEYAKAVIVFYAILLQTPALSGKPHPFGGIKSAFNWVETMILDITPMRYTYGILTNFLNFASPMMFLQDKYRFIKIVKYMKKYFLLNVLEGTFSADESRLKFFINHIFDNNYNLKPRVEEHKMYDINTNPPAPTIANLSLDEKITQENIINQQQQYIMYLARYPKIIEISTVDYEKIKISKQQIEDLINIDKFDKDKEGDRNLIQKLKNIIQPEKRYFYIEMDTSEPTYLELINNHHDRIEDQFDILLSNPKNFTGIEYSTTNRYLEYLETIKRKLEVINERKKSKDENENKNANPSNDIFIVPKDYRGSLLKEFDFFRDEFLNNILGYIDYEEENFKEIIKFLYDHPKKSIDIFKDDKKKRKSLNQDAYKDWTITTIEYDMAKRCINNSWYFFYIMNYRNSGIIIPILEKVEQKEFESFEQFYDLVVKEIFTAQIEENIPLYLNKILSTFKKKSKLTQIEDIEKKIKEIKSKEKTKEYIVEIIEWFETTSNDIFDILENKDTNEDTNKDTDEEYENSIRIILQIRSALQIRISKEETYLENIKAELQERLSEITNEQIQNQIEQYTKEQQKRIKQLNEYLKKQHKQINQKPDLELIKQQHKIIYQLEQEIQDTIQKK